MAFDQAYPSVVMAWIRFLTLPSYLYNRKIITKIGELVGKVVKLDMNTDSRTRGRFVRMTVNINLEKPLVSQILINDRSQKYGHVENICNFRIPNSTVEVNTDSSVTAPENQNLNVERSEKKDENYRPWMIVERKSSSRALAVEAVSEEVIDREILQVEGTPPAHRFTSSLKGTDR
ncbi:hypothetical protein PVK06_018123 [Gossypium arboreum]|uniref:DUF4283 domain-containing protein n=1 Tax=Gossypium arboreum TaxID=29729 RepID=A0ABR0Q5E2_GOSAR|nr:hypothetical protein PVK06_018123 [Gossypium arboreum]